jgi:hypothetical protein
MGASSQVRGQEGEKYCVKIIMRLVKNNWKGFGSKQSRFNRGCCPYIFLEGLKKIQKISFRITAVPAEN